MSEYKRCSKCDIVKELSEFCFRKNTQKNRNQCRDFIKLITKGYQTMNKDEIKIRIEKNVTILKTWRDYIILIIVNVIEIRFNFIGKIIFKKTKRNCTRKLTREKMKKLSFD